MADLYKELGNLIVETIDDEWKKVVIKITSSMNRMCIFDCSYSDNSENIRKFSFDKMKGFLMGKNVFALQASMSPEHKWNKAIYTLEKDGHFDMTFEWDQALQDEWDNAQDQIMTKITGTNTYIDVELDDRTVRILGEIK